MTGYTPSIREIQDSYTSDQITHDGYTDPITEDEADARFNRGIEAVRQEAKAKVLREAANIISGDRPLPVGYGDTKTLDRDSRTTVAEWLELNADGIEAGGIDNIESGDKA